MGHPDTELRELQVTAAEKAMEDIGAALDGYFEGDVTAIDALHMVARANGAYSVERIGDGK